MADYSGDWQKAKKKFTDDTGLEKPTEKGSLLFVSWRKPSGIEDALKDIDKHVNDTKQKDKEKDDFYKKFNGYATTVKNKSAAYLKTLEEAIKAEKEGQGKSDKYRHMKVFKATLDSIVARVEQYYTDQMLAYKMRKDQGGKALTKIQTVLKTLMMLGTNLKSGVGKGVKFYQEVLANPTPDAWSKINSDDGARSASQSISNIVKYVYADQVELLMKGTEKALQEIEILDDPAVAEQLRKLNIFLFEYQAKIEAMGTETGASGADGSLAFLANKGAARMPNGSRQEITAAAKRFGAMMKDCTEIATQLLRFGK